MSKQPPAWLTEGWPHIWLPYAQMKTAPTPLAVVGAKGSRLKLSDGSELIDGVASWWTVVHGYNHPHIASTVARQLETLPHVMLGGLAHEQAYTLAKRLARLLPGELNRVFFSDSGSVAVEVALKMAMQFWINRGERNRTKIVSFKGGYHGDTFATMAICDPDEGMRALAATLAPSGAFAGMVYAAPSRTGVYMMQDVFRRLGVQADKNGIAFARRALASMPRWHFVQHYGLTGAEHRDDAAFVDTFLHPQDRAYTVPQVLELIEQNGLSFQGWFENNAYYPQGSAWLSDELCAQISALPEREQWATMEMIGLAKLNHFFIARKGAAYPVVFDQRWRGFVPHLRRGLKRLSANEYQRLCVNFSLSLEETELLDRADGARTLGEIQEAAPRSKVRGLFERLWKQGHVMIELGCA